MLVGLFWHLEPRQDNDEDNNRPKVDNFDEEAYLAGQITIVGGSPAVPNRGQ